MNKSEFLNTLAHQTEDLNKDILPEAKKIRILNNRVEQFDYAVQCLVNAGKLNQSDWNLAIGFAEDLHPSS